MKYYKVIRDCRIDGEWKNINDIIEAKPETVRNQVSNGLLVAVSDAEVPQVAEEPAEDAVEAEDAPKPRKKAAKKKSAAK